MTQPPDPSAPHSTSCWPPRTEDEPRSAAPPTEWEEGTPPTDIEVPAARPRPGPRRDTRRLPHGLRERFRLRAVLRDPTEPHQAAVYRVEDDSGLHILKWYDRDHAPDPQVWRLLSGQPRPHLLHLTETHPDGADGHPYDLAPSFGETDLATFLADHLTHSGSPVQRSFVFSIVRQLHEALTELHGLGIVHRDVSPSNIMLRTVDPTEPDVVLVDIGVSAFAATERYSARDERWVGTIAYMSPQELLRHQLIHPPADWWSLGVIVAEMAGGRHPMHPVTDPDDLRDEIVSRGPHLSRIADPRLELLCTGLLTLDHERRWGSEEVAEWLAGRSPRVAPAHPGAAPGWPDRAALQDIPPFTFLGTEHALPLRLARAFNDNWNSAKALLKTRAGRERLADWLGRFEDSGLLDADDLTTVLDLLRGGRPAPTLLVRVITCLGPTLEASYRGQPFDPAGLHELIRAAEHDDEWALSVVADLRKYTILPLLAGRPGGEELRHVHQRWLSARSRWDGLVDEVAGLAAPLHEVRREVRDALGPDDQRDVALLALAAAPAASRRRLGELADERLRGPAGAVDWYCRLTTDRGDLVRLHLADRLTGFAERAALADEIRRETDRRVVRALLARDAAEMWLRRQEMPLMLGWAAGGALALVLPWIFVIGISDLVGHPAQETVLVAWLLAVPGAAAVLALELWTAYRIGSPGYHPELSLAGRAIDAFQRPARFLRLPGARFPVRGLLILLPCALLWLTMVYAAWAWPAGTVAGLAWWTWYRLRLWRRRTARLRHGPAEGDRPQLTAPYGRGAHR